MAVVVGNYCKKGAGERSLAKANISYIQVRPGRDKQRLTRTLFGAGGSMGRYEAYGFITDAPPGTYFYRLKLSPDPKTEDVKRDLHMQKLTRQMMRNLERRLKTPLPWAAAVHGDHTDIRHVHILAAIPRRLRTYDLEFLIKEATVHSLSQRRFLDRGASRLPWQEHVSPQPLQTGKYTSFSAIGTSAGNSSRPRRHRWGRLLRIAHASCTCPRCHMVQSHIGHQGNHLCQSCGLILHKTKALRIQRGRERERSR
jgi:hypothetical protein